MKRRYGDMWQRWPDADLFLVTGSSTCNQSGYLVMGVGSAGEAATRFKSAGITKSLGQIVSKAEVIDRHMDLIVYRPYYLIVSERWPQGKLGLLQTKDYYADLSDIFLVSASIKALEDWIPRGREVLGRDPLVVMPMPGTGTGGLSTADVLVYVRTLPDCVEVWQHKTEQGISLRPEHRLAPLLDCSYNEFKTAVLGILGEPFDEDFMIKNLGAITSPGMTERERLQRFFLLESYLENGGSHNNAWMAARNKLLALEREVEADGY